MAWDSAFQSIAIPPIKIRNTEETIEINGYREIKLYHPGLQNLGCGQGNYWLDQEFCWKAQKSKTSRGECEIELTNGKVQSAFCKITHILDPIRWVKNRYELSPLAAHRKSWKRAQAKLNDPMNQAYVEAVTYYCVSKLREMDVSPHFPYSYGSFSAIAENYRFNITDEFDSYKNTRWFWKARDRNAFRLVIESDDTPSEKEEWTRRPSFINDTTSDSSSDSTDDSESNSSDESLAVEAMDEKEGSIRTADDLSFKSQSSEEVSEDESEDSTYELEPKFYIELQNIPVMMMFLEKNDGVMDELLENPDLVGAESGTSAWDTIWSAWIFQVIAGLCVAQATLSLTHNDLHTNNIVWAKTEKKYIYYSTRDGTRWKVPTYGKIFRIIDFGRAILRIGDRVVYSDDFRSGNDAATQYNFGPLQSARGPVVTPNPSFDLTRLAVSLFENLFPEEPKLKTDGDVLSKEEGLEVLETKSELYNILWKWMLTRSGENVLITPDGDEKYPSFDLYTVIAAECEGARPRDQVRAKPFSDFIMGRAAIPKNEKVYSLFF